MRKATNSRFLPQKNANGAKKRPSFFSEAPGLRWFAFCLVVGGLVPASAAPLTSADLATIFGQASRRANEAFPAAVIAIVDRDGRALLVRRAGSPAPITAAERALAVSKAGTAVFLSSNQNAFTPRTAAFIIQQNFPPFVLNRPPGPLVGVGLSNLAFSDINYLREADGSRIPGTRLSASPGGVPLYQGGELAAGIGVTGDGTELEDSSIGADTDEAIALAGQIGYAPDATIRGSNVFIDGIRVAYVASEARPGTAASLPIASIPAPPAPVVWPVDVLGGVRGEIRAPLVADPLPGTLNGQPRLTAAEVRSILAKAAARTLVTRAGIRLPQSLPAQVFITVVNNPAQDGAPASVLGTFRTPDATIFSWDVAIQKARTAVFFSDHTRAYSTRTVGFLAQTNYPPGLSGQPPGPFNGLQERFSLPILTGVGAANPNLPNGITIFAGGIPLYRNGVLIGAIGVSGDGIEQDDLIAAAGTEDFLADPSIRADNFLYLGARLPYVKFPRDSELRPAATAIAPGFSTFQALRFNTAELSAGVVAAPDFDADGDGLTNLLEYAFGRDPKLGDAAGASPVVSEDPTSHHLQVVFVRDPAATDLVYTVEGSNDLAIWTPLARGTGGAAVVNLGGALSVTETAAGGTVSVKVVDLQPMAVPGGRFLRVQVSRQ